MSKKHRRKHYQQIQPVSVRTVAASDPPTITDRDMSAYSVHKEEYKNITSDLIRVLIINGIFLVGVIILYYINKSNPFLDNWYSRLF